MTVITPVFMEGQGDGAGPSFFVASRGHHADVGGIAPGSMPPLSKTLEEVCFADARGKRECVRVFLFLALGAGWFVTCNSWVADCCM